MVNEKDKCWVWFLLFSWYDGADNEKKEKHQKDTILHLNSINIIFVLKLKIINAAINFIDLHITQFYLRLKQKDYFSFLELTV